MQSDLCDTVWFFCALILYTCARELIQINRNSLEGQGIESKCNFVAGVCRNFDNIWTNGKSPMQTFFGKDAPG